MAIKANIEVEQGTDFGVTIDIENDLGQIFDLTNYTAASQMRKNYSSSVATTFTATHNNTGGVITLTLSNSQTETLEPGRYLYDVEITSSSGKKTRVVEGVVTVTPGITRV